MECRVPTAYSRLNRSCSLGSVLQTADSTVRREPWSSNSTFSPVQYMVCGGPSRTFDHGHRRIFGNRVVTLATNILYNTMLTDMETCYKAMTRQVADALDLQSQRFGIEPEITCKVARLRARVWEVPTGKPVTFFQVAPPSSEYAT